MIELDIINAGDCTNCGKPILLPPRDDIKQLKMDHYSNTIEKGDNNG